MKAPLIWLKDFTDIDVDVKTLADAMTISGSKVETIETTGDNISDVYTGKITDIKDHPDSDHLHIVTVDMGRDDLGHALQIVCGAPNVYVGMICPVAVIGAQLPGGSIKKGKLRGVDSYGMCCSIDELGVPAEGHPGADEYGLWNMPQDTPLGVDIKEILGLGDSTIEFEITPNRPDCFSIEGLGREAAITMGKEFRPVKPVLKQEGSLVTEDVVKIDIEAPDLCYRYCGRLVEDVKIGPSPAWMAERLTQAGMRPINNIVDITNYICLELGQPMHAFDLNYLSGKHIIVRTAKDGEVIRTLDGTDHTLTSSNLVIADEEKACAIAGVMGGENSEVLPETTTILFESAMFNPVSVRKTALSNGLRTESSARYEKNLDPENTMRALDRACELVELLGCGKVSKGVVDNYPTPRTMNHIPFRPSKINEFLGINADESFMRDVLTRLECTFATENGTEVIIPPTFRPDLEAEADIAEEVARFYGYNNIEPSLLSGKETTLGGRTYSQNIVEKICNTLVSNGYFEAITYSFEAPSELDNMLLPEDSPLRKQVKIRNPLGDDTSVMRTSMIPSMMRIASRNYNRGVQQAKVFESAFVYLPDDDVNNLPEERRMLCGFNYSGYVNADNGKVFYETRDAVEELLKILGIRSYSFEPLTDNPTFHPGCTAQILVNGRNVGIIGIIHPDVAGNFNAPDKTCLFDIEVEPLVKASKLDRTYKSIPRFPAIPRDLSVVVSKDVSVSKIIKTAKAAGGKYLEDCVFFNVYEDDKLGADVKAVAISLTFRAPDRTLADSDIAEDINRVLAKLEEKCGAKLR
ncbi:phenylalanyl-tRNA synthetase beta subunit [Ruminococcaceae bacterium YRB3002]|nr:phenylalanyl-tRNA synthetase beta subunit [Ruminococcaceae bacterium YRB3002]